MTIAGLMQRLEDGAAIWVVRVRAVKIYTAGFVDAKSGFERLGFFCAYFVEPVENGRWEWGKIIRRLPADTDNADALKPCTLKGKIYAFEISTYETKNDVPVATMGTREPVEMELSAAPTDAPQGAAGGAAP